MTVAQDAASPAAQGQGEPQAEPQAGESGGFLAFSRKAALKLWDLACEHWFILGVGFAIGFAAAVPNFGRNGGWVAAQWSIKYGAVIIIFILSGLSLKSKVLAVAAARLHVHLLIQAISLGLTPLIGYAVARAMRTAGPWLNQDLVSGLIVCMSMPTTISTNVVFTKQAGGNDAIALINAVIGNIIGIFVSPGLLVLYLGESGQAPYATVLQTLAGTIIAPLVVGQIVQYVRPQWPAWLQARINFGKVSNAMIILLVWNTFCNTFHKDTRANARSVVLIVFVLLIFYLAFTALCLAIAWGLRRVPLLHKIFRVTRPDSVAFAMCGATKTLALGMPLISVVYKDRPSAGLLALPLIVYHAGQILQGSLLIPSLRKWVKDGDAADAAKAKAAAAAADASGDASAAPGLDGAKGGSADGGKGAQWPSAHGSASNGSTADAGVVVVQVEEGQERQNTGAGDVELGPSGSASAAAGNTGDSKA